MGWIDREEGWLERPERRPRAAPGAPASSPEISAEPPEPVVRWVPVRCPFCHSKDAPVIGSPKGIAGMRYHKCRDCGEPFKSFEVNPDRGG